MSSSHAGRESPTTLVLDCRDDVPELALMFDVEHATVARRQLGEDVRGPPQALGSSRMSTVQWSLGSVAGSSTSMTSDWSLVSVCTSIVPEGSTSESVDWVMGYARTHAPGASTPGAILGPFRKSPSGARVPTHIYWSGGAKNYCLGAKER